MLATTLIACDGDVQRLSVSRRDSVGITIVESTSPQWRPGDGWHVDPEASLDLATSGTGPPHEFFQVQDATRLPDGTIAVADRGSSEVRFFSATGSFLGAAGREGEGPGEFKRLTSVAQFRGDSVVAFDYWLGRVTVLDPEWEVSRIMSPHRPDVRVRELHPLGDTILVAMIYPLAFLQGTEGLYRMPHTIVELSLNGELIDTIAVIAGFDGFGFSRGDARPLFARAGHLAVHQERIYLGSADSMQLEVYSATGQLEQIIRIPGFDLRITDQELREERAAMFLANAPQWLRDVAAAMPDPKTRPAYSDLLVDREGFVWAAEYHARTQLLAATDWEVFTPDGEWLGAVRLPPRFKVFEIGSDYILGRLQDDLDVEHVQLLSLSRR